MEAKPAHRGSDELSTGQLASIACLLEVAAPKPGNVHRSADFEDMTFQDFQLSAIAVGPALDRAGSEGVGTAILGAMEATRRIRLFVIASLIITVFPERSLRYSLRLVTVIRLIHLATSDVGQSPPDIQVDRFLDCEDTLYPTFPIWVSPRTDPGSECFLF